MIWLLFVSTLASQAIAASPKRQQTVVIADVKAVPPVKAPPCPPEMVCPGVPDVARIVVRKVLLGDGNKGRMTVTSGAPVNIKVGRYALLMDWANDHWFVIATSAADAPCFEAQDYSPQNAIDRRLRRVDTNLCLTPQ